MSTVTTGTTANSEASTAPAKGRASMGLPDRFIRKPRRALRVSQNPGINGSHLPFEAKTPNHDAPHWNIPATGGIHGGIETGAHLAFAVMKQRRSVEFQTDNQFQLVDIVQSMMARDRQLVRGTDEHITFQRQVKGFMGLITRAMDYYLCTQAETHEILDGATMDEILADANRGLGLNVEAYEAWLNAG